jgi:antirestriction protein ArdC
MGRLTGALSPVGLDALYGRAAPSGADTTDTGDRQMRANDLIDTVTADLIAAIEAGAYTWQMPWHTIATAGQPVSADGRPYRGMNTWILSLTAAERGWTSNTWATYRTWQRHDAQVRRGEKATRVLLWKPTDRTATDDADDEIERRGLICRTFSVFAAEQVDGYHIEQADDDRDAPGRIDDADAYFERIGLDVSTGHNHACYRPALDRIEVPDLVQFSEPALYYSTLAHEHIHATGHDNRLARDLSGRFGSDSYAVEELIAELGAAFWAARAGVALATRNDHAAYLAHWLRVLREHPGALVTVCSKAQHALDWLDNAAGSPTVDTLAEAVTQ